MLSVIIHDNGEPKVLELTYENLHKEIKNMEGTELIVAKDWLAPIKAQKNKYVCLVEADCLVSSGYFASMMGLINKNSHLRKLGIFGTATGVNHFGNRFYGYELDERWVQSGTTSDGKEVKIKQRRIEPVRTKKSNAPYPVQMAYVPGAILRTNMMIDAIEKLPYKVPPLDDLTRYSANLSLYFWSHGARVHINPNATYVTTEDYVNDLNITEEPKADVLEGFKRESI